jgi:N-acetylglucosaminyl-diphospho-decaprenol L-rhamnosyltransferase
VPAGGPIVSPVEPCVAVVVVSYDAREALAACLDSLSRHGGLVCEVVVVDNASKDDSAEAVRARGPAVRLIGNSDNLGFARACNQGLGATSAPLVLFLNPDATVAAGAVEALAARLRGEGDVGAVGPLTRHPDGTIQVSTGPDLPPLAELRQRRLVRGLRRRDPGALREAEERHAREHEPGWVSGSCLMARREALEAVGGFDEGFFLYEEDADLCRRLRRAGWRVVFTPAAQIRHQLGRSMARSPLRARLEYQRSHLLYYRKHNGHLATTALRLVLLGRSLAALGLSALAADAAGRKEAAALVRLALGRI